LFDKRLLEVRNQRAYAETILKENDEVWERVNDYVSEIQDFKKRLEIFKGKLAVISGIAEVARESIGRTDCEELQGGETI
jgi:hypothetical protein